jgi:hypothetical protein
VVEALKIEAGSNGAVATLFANAEDERNDLRRNAIPDVVWSPRLIPKPARS